MSHGFDITCMSHGFENYLHVARFRHYLHVARFRLRLFLHSHVARFQNFGVLIRLGSEKIVSDVGAGKSYADEEWLGLG